MSAASLRALWRRTSASSAAFFVLMAITYSTLAALVLNPYTVTMTITPIKAMVSVATGKGALTSRENGYHQWVVLILYRSRQKNPKTQNPNGKE